MHSNLKKDMRSWILRGVFFLATVFTGGILYAAIGSVWTAPPTLETTSGSGLTATSWNKLLANFNNLDARSVPTGAIMAFSGTVCPNDWTEYLPARGRFLRGIDTTNSTAIDPDGLRTPGSLQADELKSHNHVSNVDAADLGLAQSADGVASSRAAPYARTTSYVQNTGWPETRPKNAAVLFCIKN